MFYVYYCRKTAKMLYGNFFQELLGGPQPVQKGARAPYIKIIDQLVQGHILHFDPLPPLKLAMFGNNLMPWDDKTDPEQSKVAVIPVSGLLTREGSWWDYSTQQLADLFTEANNNPSVESIILRINSHGGTTQSVIPLAASILNKQKPVIAAVDSMAQSAAYYIASFADEIIAVHKMAEIGSIGMMARILDWNKYYEENGIKEITVYPPESKWKNRAYEEAKAGKPELLIAETLSPWAVHFQETVRENRAGKLKEETEGLLEGREFYAYDAKENGLIDKIMPYDKIIEYAFSLSKQNQFKTKISNLFTQN
jgi:protease-4